MADSKTITPIDFVDEMIPFVDDEGNEFDMEIVEMFNYDNMRFALLAEPHTHEHAEDEECSCEEESLYIFEIKEDDEGIEYIAVEDDDLLDELIAAIEEASLFASDDE